MEGGVKYWLVGAYWKDPKQNYDMSDLFSREGYWEMGWDDDEKPEFAKLRRQMKTGDRIAIKARGGRGQPHILIKAIGIVGAVDPIAKRVHVDWKLTGLSRKVPAKGKFSTVHKPLSPRRKADQGRIREIFTI